MAREDRLAERIAFQEDGIELGRILFAAHLVEQIRGLRGELQVIRRRGTRGEQCGGGGLRTARALPVERGRAPSRSERRAGSDSSAAESSYQAASSATRPSRSSSSARSFFGFRQGAIPAQRLPEEALRLGGIRQFAQVQPRQPQQHRALLVAPAWAARAPPARLRTRPPGARPGPRPADRLEVLWSPKGAPAEVFSGGQVQLHVPQQLRAAALMSRGRRGWSSDCSRSRASARASGLRPPARASASRASSSYAARPSPVPA